MPNPTAMNLKMQMKYKSTKKQISRKLKNNKNPKIRVVQYLLNKFNVISIHACTQHLLAQRAFLTNNSRFKEETLLI